MNTQKALESAIAQEAQRHAKFDTGVQAVDPKAPSLWAKLDALLPDRRPLSWGVHDWTLITVLSLLSWSGYLWLDDRRPVVMPATQAVTLRSPESLRPTFTIEVTEAERAYLKGMAIPYARARYNGTKAILEGSLNGTDWQQVQTPIDYTDTNSTWNTSGSATFEGIAHDATAWTPIYVYVEDSATTLPTAGGTIVIDKNVFYGEQNHASSR